MCVTADADHVRKFQTLQSSAPVRMGTRSAIPSALPAGTACQKAGHERPARPSTGDPRGSPSGLASAASPCSPPDHLSPTWTHCGVFPALFSSSFSGLPASSTACEGERVTEKADRLSAGTIRHFRSGAHPGEVACTGMAAVRAALDETAVCGGEVLCAV